MVTAATDITDATSAPARTTREWVEAFAEGWRAPDGPDGLIAHFRALLDDDVRLIQPQLGTLVGFRAFEEGFVRPLFALVPDLRAEVDRWAVNGEDAFIEITLRGTLGGREIAWRACDRVTLRDGLLIERESHLDPGPLVAAVLRAPRLWPRFIRIQLKRAGRRKT
jgi:hypothetical protein